MTETAEVYVALQAEVRGWFTRRAPADRVDDLVQDAFVRIHRGLPALQDRDRLAPWVFRICRSVLIDGLRRDRDEDSLDVDLIDPGPTPDRDDATAQVAGWLPAFVEGLPETYREAVRLSELEGLSQAEVATRLGLSASGARSRVQRGRRLLRAALDDCCQVTLEGGEVVDVQPGARCACGPTSAP